MLDSSESEEDLGDDCLDWNHLDDNEALDQSRAKSFGEESQDKLS